MPALRRSHVELPGISIGMSAAAANIKVLINVFPAEGGRLAIGTKKLVGGIDIIHVVQDAWLRLV